MKAERFTSGGPLSSVRTGVKGQAQRLPFATRAKRGLSSTRGES